MKRQLSGFILLGAIFGYAHAQGEVYLCVNDSGVKEYKNTGITKGCKKVELPGITTIPAPAKRSEIKTASAKGSSDFPKVDGNTQKARDTDRKQILLDEMKAEELKLAALEQEYNNGEPERQGNERNYAKYQERTASLKSDLERTEKNIEALRREIGNLK
jgi:hypothetical protein